MNGMLNLSVKIDRPDCPVESEHFWAKQIGPDTAKVRNVLCFTKDFTLGDLVRFDVSGQVVEVVERGPRPVELIYDNSGTRDEIRDRFKAIAVHLKKHEIYCEGMSRGLLVMAVPADMDRDHLSDIIGQLGIDFELEPEPETT